MRVLRQVRNARWQAGVTVIEFMAFVGLAALTIAAAIALFSGTRNSTKSTELINTANHVANSIRRSFPYGSGATSALSASNIVATMNGVGKITGWGNWQLDSGNRAAIQKGTSAIHVIGGTNSFWIVIITNDQSLCESMRDLATRVGDAAAIDGCSASPNWLNYGPISF